MNAKHTNEVESKEARKGICQTDCEVSKNKEDEGGEPHDRLLRNEFRRCIYPDIVQTGITLASVYRFFNLEHDDRGDEIEE